MTTTTELVGSRNSKTGASITQERTYKIYGTDVEADVLTELDAESPTTITYDSQTLYRNTRDINQVGYLVWEGRVEYKMLGASAGPVGGARSSFTTMGGNEHITNAIENVSKTAATGTAPDFEGAIGFNGETVEGVAVYTPSFNFSETHVISSASVDNAYKSTLATLTGKTNQATFRGFVEGEVLFLGASGNQREDGNWEIQFSFAANKNQTGLSFGAITGIAKNGWEYLWVLYETYESNNRLSKKPSSVYVEKVYNDGDFDGLGI